MGKWNYSYANSKDLRNYLYECKFSKNAFKVCKYRMEQIIEWSKYHEAYIIQFKDKKEQIYGCVIGPKYFPVNIGQGILAIQEEYRRY